LRRRGASCATSTISIAASLSSFTDPMWHVKDRSIAGLRIGATGGVGQALSLGALVAVRQSDVSGMAAWHRAPL
jgi:hypothetical protein